MNSGESGMNPGLMTIINPRKEYWPSRGSNQQPPVLKSAILPTELWGLAEEIRYIGNTDEDSKEFRYIENNNAGGGGALQSLGS